MRKSFDSKARRRRSAWPVSLVLTLLLAFAPLLSIAQSMPPLSTAGETADGDTMPCHTHAGAGGEAATALAPCPHCNGDAPLSQCQCCGYAVPAGLIAALVIAYSSPQGSESYDVRLPEDLPMSPDERLFRPPIQSS